jgi:hypothetical protein
LDHISLLKGGREAMTAIKVSMSTCIRHAKDAVVRPNSILKVLALAGGLLLATWLVLAITQPVTAILEPPAAAVLSSSESMERAPRHMPLAFVENAGQFDDRVSFQARNGNMTLFLSDDALWISLRESLANSPETCQQVNLKLSFPGANPQPRLEPFDRLDARVSYFYGSDDAQWHTDLPTWAGVRYLDLYPGLDLEIISQEGHLALRLLAGEHSSLQKVRLRVQGADALILEGDHLRVNTPVGAVTLPLLTVEGSAPQVGPAILSVDGAYEVTTPFAPPSPPSVAEQPIATTALRYSTYLGGSCEDRGYDIAVDSAGHVYVTGQIASADFPTTPGAYDLDNNDNPPGCEINDWTGEAFVTKLSTDGSTLLYSTYLGGNSEDAGYGIAVDVDGSVYLAGKTYSTDFPTTEGALDAELSGGRDAFVAKLNATGDELIYSTYLGGSYWEYGLDVAVDPQGYAYVTGFTHGGFPTTPGVWQPSPGGSIDGFVVKLNLVGTAMVYSTYLGGSLNDGGSSLAVDDNGHAYITGGTHSTDFPTVNPLQSSKAGGDADAFVAKLSADGRELIYSTYLGAGAGGSGGEAGHGIVIDNTGNAYVIGATDATGFPTVAPIQPDYGGGDLDAFLAKINADGDALIYSTYYGGNGTDRGLGIGIDLAGAAYITGYTSSTDLVTVDPLQATNAGGYDAFLAKADHLGSALVFSTYLGGSMDDNLYGVGQGDAGIAVSWTGKVYLTGLTASPDFPTTPGALNTDFTGGDSDAFVTSLDLGPVFDYKLWFPLIAAP